MPDADKFKRETQGSADRAGGRLRSTETSTAESSASLIEIGSGVGEGESAFEAGESAARAAMRDVRQHAISCVLVYASLHHDVDSVLRGVHAVVGEVPVFGVTTAGELHNGIRQQSVVVAVLASPHVRVCAGVGQHVSVDWQGALDEAMASPGLRSAFDVPDEQVSERIRKGSRLFAMLFTPGNTRESSSVGFELLEALKIRTLGQLPIFAGCAADDWQMAGNAVFLGQRAYPDGLLLAVFETELSYGIALGHGFRPSAVHLKATEVEGHEVVAFDGRPAAAALASALGSSEAELATKHVTLTTGRTLGTRDPLGQYSVNVAAYFTNRHGVRLTQPVAIGSEMIVMESVPESLLAASSDALRKALLRAGVSRPAAVLCHYCALRPRVVGNESAAREIADMVQLADGAPLVGFCSFGEGGLADDGISRHNNASVAVLAFGNELSEHARVARENERLRQRLAAQAEDRFLENALRQTEEAFAVADSRHRFRYVNAAFSRLFGYGVDEVVGRPIELLAPETEDVILSSSEAACRAASAGAFRGEVRRRAKDGQLISVILNLAPLRNEENEIQGYVAAYTDIAERERGERTQRKLNRALTAISECNSALIHAADEIQLLQELCRITVEVAGYRLAWVGYPLHDKEKTVKVVAHAGYGGGYMEQARIVWAENQLGNGPAGKAIRTRRTQVTQDALTDPDYAPWRENAIRIGYGSVLSLPLCGEDAVFGVLTIYAAERKGFDSEEIRLLSELANDLAFGIATLRLRAEHRQDEERLQRSMEATISAIAATVDMRDPYTAGHQRRVAELAVAIASDLELPQDEIRGVHLAGIVHDMGKIAVPAEILAKPRKLTWLEYEMIKTHAEIGYDLLKEIDFPWPIAQIVLQHHERLDGSGYPRGLRGEAILIGARILAVADTVEAMASHRPYRPGLGIEAALEEVQKGREKLYDGRVVDACLRLFREKGFSFSQ